MNFQQLVAKLKLEAGRQGAAPASPGTSSTQDSRLWGWIADEWESLQTRGVAWRFMRTTATISLQSGKSSYSEADVGLAFQRPWPTDDEGGFRPRAFHGSSSYLLNPQVDYDRFRLIYMPGHVPGLPQLFAVTPSNSLLFGPTPDRAMTVEMDFVRPPAVMANPTDQPSGLPIQHRKILVWGALKRLAVDDAAQELLQRANTEYSEAWNRLWDDQGPVVRFDRRGL